MQSIFSSAIIPLSRQFHYFAHLFHDAVIIIPAVRNQAFAAVLNAIFQESKITAASIAQGIKGTIAE
jgi:hypothetical protein